VMKSVPPSALAEVIDVVVTYLKAIGYRGLFGAEVKRDARDGVVKLLEINARSMGSNHFPAACGVNSVLLAYLDLLGEDVPRVKDYDVGVYEIKFLRDIRVLVRMFAAGQLSREAMLPYVRKHLYYLFSWDDPMPFAAHLIGLSRSLMETVST
jgi:D-aspartate ligase